MTELLHWAPLPQRLHSPLSRAWGTVLVVTASQSCTSHVLLLTSLGWDRMAVDKRKSHGSTADGRSPLKGSGLQTGRYPSIKPNFTLKDIRNAIPAHCFKRSAAISLRYLVSARCTRRRLRLSPRTTYMCNWHHTYTVSVNLQAIDVLLIVLLGYASTWIDHPVVPRCVH